MIHFSVKVDPNRDWVVIARADSKDAAPKIVAGYCSSFSDCMHAARGYAQKQGDEKYEVEVE